MNLYFYASKILTPLILPSNFLIFALVIFFYLGVYRNKDKFKKIFFVIFIIFSSISLLPIGENLIFYVLEKNYKNSKLPKNIDYIFVPSGSSERIVQAIKIKNQYLPTKVKIIYSSGNSALDSNKGIDSEAPFVQTIVNNSNIDKKDIVFLPNARNTIENFKQLNHYLGKGSDQKILLITSSFHMKRSLIIAKKNNIKAYGLPSNFYTKNNSFSLINFYQNINFIRNLSYFDRFFKELIGIFVVKIIL
tara:strand:- start:209 stop:952 length:744 start_codon:yes stop_codon:yes gene_type:complete